MLVVKAWCSANYRAQTRYGVHRPAVVELATTVGTTRRVGLLGLNG